MTLNTLFLGHTGMYVTYMYVLSSEIHICFSEYIFKNCQHSLTGRKFNSTLEKLQLFNSEYFF